MLKDTYCDCCRTQLSAGREFAYQFESLKFLDHDSLRYLKHLDDETLLESIRKSPDYLGEPLRLCQRCSTEIEANRQAVEEEALNQARQDRVAKWISVVGAVIGAITLLAIWIYARSL